MELNTRDHICDCKPNKLNKPNNKTRVGDRRSWVVGRVSTMGASTHARTGLLSGSSQSIQMSFMAPKSSMLYR